LSQQFIVPEELENKLAQMAAEAGISTPKLAEIIIRGFVEGEGKLFVGKWKEGPGLRILPDWPRFSSCIIKLKNDELKGA
jgi:hypothetical protein